MRKKEREIKDFGEIADVLRRADTIRLGINDDPYPYVVPLSYGYKAENGRITIYFHGAKEGLKHELLQKCNHVCIETDIFYKYSNTGCGITSEYESIIGFGDAEIINGDEAVKGLDLLLEHCGAERYEYDKSVIDIVSVYKIELVSFTGKRRII